MGISIFHRTPALRWVVPGTVAALIIGGGAAIGTVTADAAAAPLPARSAAQLVADVHDSALTGLSGTVVQTSDLGLPDLPSVGTMPLLAGLGSSDLTSLIAGTHTLRLWYAGPQRIRVALLGSLGESDIIRNGADLWIWSSTDNTAVHHTLPERHRPGDGARASGPSTDGIPVSPQQAAGAALAAISPSTEVSTEQGVTVAGRSAYELVLRPKDGRSLVSSVRIAIDAVKHVPLRVRVYAKDQPDPAFEVGFTSVDFSRPDAAEFAFDPPPGAAVHRAGRHAGDATTPNPAHPHEPGATAHEPGGMSWPGAPGTTGPAAEPGRTRIVGSGWTSVLVTGADPGMRDLVGGAGPAGGHAADDRLSRVLGALPRVSGSWGSGRLLRTALFSAVITDDGRLAAGAVAPGLLYAALGSS